MVLWPRPKEYFTRGSGWAGKLKADDGTVMNDSVANNATAHYLHNMLYVTGAEYSLSSEVISLKADLIRVNNIENFDTAVIKFKTDNGADGLFVASHSTKELHNPIFEYRFSNGTVSYNDDDKTIIGKLNDGTIKEYGNPFENTNKKIYDAINSCGKKDYIPPCGVKAAAAHVRCIEKIQENPIKNVNKAYIKENGTFLFVEGLDELMFKCYNEEKLPSEYKDFEKLVDC